MVQFRETEPHNFKMYFVKINAHSVVKKKSGRIFVLTYFWIRSQRLPIRLLNY